MAARRREDPGRGPDAGIGQRQGEPLALAPDVAFHSPMLTKTARGEQNVRDIHKLIGGIQGREPTTQGSLPAAR